MADVVSTRGATVRTQKPRSKRLEPLAARAAEADMLDIIALVIVAPDIVEFVIIALDIAANLANLTAS